MRMTRRPILRGLAAGGVLFAAGGARSREALAMADTAEPPLRPAIRPLTAIVGGSAYDAAFLAGFRAAAVERGMEPAVLAWDRMNPADFAQLMMMLEAGQPTTLVGLVDDGSASVVLELARTAGARTLWLGHHRASAQAGPDARHRILSAAAASHVPYFGEAIAAGGEAHALFSQRPGQERPPRRSTSLSASGGESGAVWPATLGQILVAAADPEAVLPPTKASALAAHKPKSAGDAYVSFSCII
jgi:hypothetical protein